MKQTIAQDTYYVGASDRRISLFENVYPLPDGVSYNSYVIIDECTALLDTADMMVGDEFLDNVAMALDGRELDYLVINHMEPDHCACIERVLTKYPTAKVLTNAKVVTMIGEYFDIDISQRVQIVKENDVVSLGKHQLTFVMTPMVHWPEVMMTFDATTGVLFSADAFGTFGALSGNIFADKAFKGDEWLDEARRYYTNIVGKYGAQTKMALTKAGGLDIKVIAPLHGPVWRKNIDQFIAKYSKWANYQSEDKEVLIVYGSIYGHTARAVDLLARELDNFGVEHIKMYDASKTDVSVLVAETFRCSHIVIASSTYNAGIFTPVERYLAELVSHNVQNKTIAIVENGTWAPTAGNAMLKEIEKLKNITLLDNKLTIKASFKQTDEPALKVMAQQICQSLKD